MLENHGPGWSDVSGLREQDLFGNNVEPKIHQLDAGRQSRRIKLLDVSRP